MSEAHGKWMPIYINDYLGDTKHLTPAEHGAYLLRLRRVVGMAAREWKASWPTIREFFNEGPDGFRHKRIDAELGRARNNIEKRREAGKAGAAKRWHGEGNAIAIANAQQNDGPSPLPLPRTEEQRSSSEESSPLPHGALAFSGRTIRLNQRDFREWEQRYSAIPDLRAELGALDDWLRGQGDEKRKNWFHVVSGALSKKHQKALAEARKPAADETTFQGFA